ncbi:RsmE family RNA methyltransferase [Croceimicrobium hydrocarbonivorans]|uniref:Ribosomal RNA small subunit methyltransferase E n=1 Tax=Croceimicrobium hydrocarbonivorans TaxID=2761580 RepID=A0A7H0VDJ4_9FLAO|nr:RsmE family RNA methyltransferase [Croceimicrobium hydrocarbonivorans]QNR23792.1 16S rRNA (uracil(1498)-N(3))-methyltransferase [Croceimicrobium hydrocarbonivorans]
MNHFLAREGNASEGFLNESDSHHASRVLRLNSGDRISISYGDGIVYEAEIENIAKKSLQFKVLDERRRQKAPLLQIGIAPTKSNDRFEWFIEKAVELGVQRIIPLLCEHSERKVYKRDRGLRIMEAAFKQSHKGFMPELSELTELKKLDELNLPEQRYIASLNNSERIALRAIKFHEPQLILIGPEGDFSAKEVAWAEKQGFKHLDLGPEVLRTETAAVQIAAIAQYEAQRPE